MAPLAHTLALLAMTVATVAIEVMPLDMALDSFDDQYRGCGPAMTAALPALNRSEFQKNPLFARVWVKAEAEWQRQGFRVSPLASPAQAITVMAYTMNDLYQQFNAAVRKAGRSPQEYRDNFHYKTFHFLLTQALVTLRNTLTGPCLDAFQEVCGVLFEAQLGDTVRFGEFVAMSLSETRGGCSGKETLFQVYTCHGVYIRFFSKHPGNWSVAIPPFEAFEVTEVSQEGDKALITLLSVRTFSKYNCEWLRGGSISLASFHLRGLLLATTALAVAPWIP